MCLAPVSLSTMAKKRFSALRSVLLNSTGHWPYHLTLLSRFQLDPLLRLALLGRAHPARSPEPLSPPPIHHELSPEEPPCETGSQFSLHTRSLLARLGSRRSLLEHCIELRGLQLWLLAASCTTALNDLPPGVLENKEMAQTRIV